MRPYATRLTGKRTVTGLIITVMVAFFISAITQSAAGNSVESTATTQAAQTIALRAEETRPPFLSRQEESEAFRLPVRFAGMSSLWFPLLPSFAEGLPAGLASLLPLSADDASRLRSARDLLAEGKAVLAERLLESVTNPLLNEGLRTPLLRPDGPRLTGWLSEIGTLRAPPRADAKVEQRTIKTFPAIRHVALGKAFNEALREGRPADAEALLLAATKAGAAADKAQPLLKPEERAKAELALAAAWLSAALPQKAQALASRIGSEDFPTLAAPAAWLSGLAAYAAQDYPAAAAAFARLAAHAELTDWDRAAAHFWQARALKRAGDQKAAREEFAKAAHFPRTLYGLLALAVAGQDPDFDWSLPRLSAETLGKISSEEKGRRALAFLQIGDAARAETELRSLLPAADLEMRHALLSLSDAARLPALALDVGGMLLGPERRVYDAALYPLPAWAPAAGFVLPPSLLYALMRQESRFDVAARSRDGAAGLLQLMPATALAMLADGERETETNAPNRPALSKILPKILQDPQQNITLGQDYLLTLARRGDVAGDVIRLLVAYNAGPGNLARWRAPLASMEDPLLFIESLPSRETRDFVKRLLTNMAIYDLRLEGETSLTKNLIAGAWPKLDGDILAAHRLAKERQLALLATPFNKR